MSLLKRNYSLGVFFTLVLTVLAWLVFMWISHARTNYAANRVDEDGQDITAPFYADQPKEEDAHNNHGDSHGKKEEHNNHNQKSH